MSVGNLLISCCAHSGSNCLCCLLIAPLSYKSSMHCCRSAHSLQWDYKSATPSGPQVAFASMLVCASGMCLCISGLMALCCWSSLPWEHCCQTSVVVLWSGRWWSATPLYHMVDGVQQECIFVLKSKIERHCDMGAYWRTECIKNQSQLDSRRIWVQVWDHNFGSTGLIVGFNSSIEAQKHQLQAYEGLSRCRCPEVGPKWAKWVMYRVPNMVFGP